MRSHSYPRFDGTHAVLVLRSKVHKKVQFNAILRGIHIHLIEKS
jgi:hypothetical protein